MYITHVQNEYGLEVLPEVDLLSKRLWFNFILIHYLPKMQTPNMIEKDKDRIEKI